MSDSQIYDRQRLIPGWDQDKLSKAKVAVIGAGALGNHVCLGLIGLGIGTIKIYDFDKIEPHNLNRQSLFCEEDIGENKAETLAKRLKERNSTITILGINQKIEEETIEIIIREVDLIIDCVDLIYVRRILNRYCLWRDIPLIHGGISWKGGQAGILTRETPCINCFYPESLQKQELEEETSCIDNPDPSVVYTSQIIAALMVQYVRKALMPLESDNKKHLKGELLKVDFRLDQPFYYEPLRRKDNCECVDILEDVAPKILEKERAQEEKDMDAEKKELEKILN